MGEPQREQGRLERIAVQLVRGRGFVWTMITLSFVALGALAFHSWEQVQPLLMEDPRYQVKLENIQITAPPEWIRTEPDQIKQQVAEAAQWKLPMWLREPQLTWDVARAFRRHPWVREVKRAHKSFPASVQVDLVYRKPVGMVEVREVSGSVGWLPIDGDGFCLITDDFREQDRTRYVEIKIPGIASRSETGPWGDARVHGAARIAETLAPYRDALNLEAIVGPEFDPTASDPLANFTLVFRDGATQGWGHPPGNEGPGEPAAKDKVRVLLKARGIGPVDSRQAMFEEQHWSVPDPTAASTTGGSIERTAQQPIRQPESVSR
ncbi:MAG: hypothetical protein U0795_02820 [Pirellulales bacterium]